MQEKEGSEISILKKLTLYLVQTYQSQNPNFCLPSKFYPKRILESINNLNITPYQIIKNYIVIDIIGKGFYGIVFKAKHISSQQIVAIKILNHNNISAINKEISILKILNSSNCIHFVKFYEDFIYEGLNCMVFEKLNDSLLDRLKLQKYHGMSIREIQTIAQQLIVALNILQQLNIVHSDLKPENILFGKNNIIKIIDFGNAIQNMELIPQCYIQTRYYRAPEVILGYPDLNKIDIWSIGCVLAELYLGIPLFPGTSSKDQIQRILKFNKRKLPNEFIQKCSKWSYYEKMVNKVNKNQLEQGIENWIDFRIEFHSSDFRKDEIEGDGNKLICLLCCLLRVDPTERDMSVIENCKLLNEKMGLFQYKLKKKSCRKWSEN